jgi:chromate reductase
MYTVAVIVGSLRKESHNLKLAKALARLGQNQFKTNFIRIDDLPLFNQDLEAELPAAVTRLKNEIEAADAVLFVTPEYNRSMPGVLKNAIDWASRPYGKNSFAKKPAAVCGISIGTIGTACAQHNLRPALAFLDVRVMNQPEVYLQFKDGLLTPDGVIGNEGTQTFLQGFVDAFALWIKSHQETAGM